MLFNFIDKFFDFLVFKIGGYASGTAFIKSYTAKVK